MDADALVAALSEQAASIRGPFPVPEWAPHVPEVYARRWTIDRRRQVNPWVSRDDPEGWAQVVYRFAVDESGQRIFTNAGHLAALKKMAGNEVIVRVANFIMENIAPDPTDEADRLAAGDLDVLDEHERHL